MQLSMFEKKINVENEFDKKNSAIITRDILKISKELPEEFFKMIVSSPPYNIGKDYEKKRT